MTGSLNYRLQTDPGAFGQHSWRRCQRCSGLFFDQYWTTGWCPAGGGHDYAGSFDHSLLMGVFPNPPYQPGWYWCPRCSGLFFLGIFFGDSSTSGWCSAGGGHQRVGGDPYSLEYGDF